MNEFAGPGTFGHSWSLAIEEKFYFIWPLLAFAIPALWRWRSWIAGLLALAAAVSGVGGGYLSVYAPIIFGCLVAILFHNERGYRIAARAARPLPASLLGTLAVTVLLLSTTNSHQQVLFGLAFGLALPTILIGPRRAHAWLTWKPLPFVGVLAYAVYLIHPLVGSVIDAVLPNRDQVPWSVAHLVLMTGLSVGAACLLHTFVEEPLKQLGRRIADAKRPVGQLPADPARA